ncbi:MAG: glycosyltransferase [Alphaproteobacteria bacterium]|nr:glycosyltransferase [Alphaproteobacteria bacterium SS10]
MAEPDPLSFRHALIDTLGALAERQLGSIKVVDAFMTIWLTRPDLRELGTDPFGFLLWFLHTSDKEYPPLNQVRPDIRRFATFGRPADLPVDVEQGDDEPPLSEGMLMIWRYLPDWREAFDITNAEGRDALFWNTVFHGVEQFEMPGLIGAEAAAYLNAPAPDLEGSDKHLVPITRLMLRTWQRDERLQAKIDIKRPKHVEALARWMLVRKLPSMGLASLAPRAWYQALDVERPKRIYAVPDQPSDNSSTVRSKGPEFGVTIYGFAYGELGIGEDARTVARALMAKGIPVEIVDIAPSQETPTGDLSLQDLVVSKPTMPIAIYCLTAMEMARVCLTSPLARNPARYRIGYWPWELSRLPKAWQFAEGLVDEVWASTQFAADAFSDLSVPVHRLPLPVVAPPKVQENRSAFGMPSDDVVFLYVFDAKSYPARKNPMAALIAFQRAFSEPVDGGRQPHLVLKTLSGRQEPEMLTALKNTIGDDDRVTIIDARFDRAEVWDLMASADAYISLHRSEGFGRTLVEAMLLGKPVIATNASGNADFMDHPLAHPIAAAEISVKPDQYPWAEPESRWFEPDISAAAAEMRQVYEAICAGEAVPDVGNANARFSLEVTGAAYAERLEQVANQLDLKTG